MDKTTTIALAGILASIAAVLAERDERYTEPTGVSAREQDEGRGTAWLANCLEDLQ